jgi:hypothetical protein
MRPILSLLLSLFLVLAPIRAFGQSATMTAVVNAKVQAVITWTLIQHKNNFTCSGTASGTNACAVTVTSTTAGNVLVVASAIFWGSSTGTNAPSFVSATGNSGDTSFTHCPSAYGELNYSGHNYEAADCAYIASATGGATSVTYNWNTQSASGNAWNIDVEFLEFHRSSGSPTIDTSNNATSSACTTCTAPTLSLSSGSDVIVQFVSVFNTLSSVAAPYATSPSPDLDSSNVFGGFAWALNQSSGTGPVWTASSSGSIAMGGVAFK